MKRLLMIGAVATMLSACVSDYPADDPYPGVYEEQRVVGYRDIYRRPVVYRDDRRDYDRPYRQPYRDDRVSERRRDDRDRRERDDDRYDRNDRRDRRDGRNDDRNYEAERPDPRGPERAAVRPGRPLQTRNVTGQIEGLPPGQNCEQGLFNKC